MAELTRFAFTKLGRARFLSHLDLMRTFRRAFRRAGVVLKLSEGFNPHPYFNTAAPLPVGVGGLRELCDTELERPEECAGLAERLGSMLPEGISVLEAYIPERPLNETAYSLYEITFEFEQPVSENIHTLFTGQPLVVPKRSKTGIKDIDIQPSIKQISFTEKSGKTLEVRAILCAGDSPLNPEYLAEAIRIYLPDAGLMRTYFERQGFLDQKFEDFG